jgi:myosin heavy subunit
LNYLAKIAGSSSGVQNKILLASPILEAWGNAKTLRNNNSSRFGKFIEIWFDKDFSIVGSSNTTYLLEKSRVVFQVQGERNYHVFYQLLKGAEPSFIRSLRLETMKEYSETVNYINQSGCITIDDVNDARDYDEVQRALLILGFSPLECQQLWTIIAIVLHLGNIEFGPSPSNSDEAIIVSSSQHHLDISIDLIGVDPFILTQALLKKKIQTGGKRASVSFSPYTVPVAIDNRNSLVKELYNRTFDWIVAKINGFVNAEPSTKRAGMIGVLDIFGK